MLSYEWSCTDSQEMADVQQRRKWYRLQWFADEDTKEERRLILKLDLLIVPYAFLAYWTKYIDQANISKTSIDLWCALY